MIHIVVISIGGALGALFRYWMAAAVNAQLGRDFPYGTLTVNVVGCLAAGFLSVLLIEKLDLNAEWRSALLIGFLGAFTTFSAFTLDTWHLIETGESFKALINVMFTVIVCLTANWVGMIAARQF